MRKRQPDVTGGNIGLSFIDVLASALGASVLLFVILASTPVSLPSRASVVGGFFRYQWTVEADAAALLRISVLAPGATDATFIPLESLRGEAIVECPSNLPGVESYALIGFTPDSTVESGNRRYVLRLNKPAKGTWQVGIMYYARSDDFALGAPSISVTAETKFDSLTTAGDGDGVVIDAIGGQASAKSDRNVLEYGAQLLSPSLDEAGTATTVC